MKTGFVGHAPHSVLPSSRLKKPSGQGSHPSRLAAPSVAPSVLTGQGRHSVLVLMGLYVPIGQSTQRDPAASASPNVPSRQASQAVAASNDEK